jgi:glucokinase
MMTENQIIGIDVDGIYARLGKVSGQTLKSFHQYKISSATSQDKIIKELILHIEAIFTSQVAGIGIGVPGIVDVDKGIVYEVTRIPSWKEVHLKDKLQKYFNVPVYVNNDANCFAAGEKYFGKGKRYRNVVGLILGEGMGAGIIVENKLYSGVNGGVGEFGKMPYREHNFEYYCSNQYFQNEVHLPFETVYDQAVKGNTKARQHFKNLGWHLADAVKSIICAVDPEIIVLGGSLSKAYPLFRYSLREGLQSFTFRRSVENVVIKVSDRENIALLGAAALYFDDMETRKIDELDAKRRKAEDEVLHRAKQATLLYEIGQRLNHSLDLDTLLTDIVTAVCDTFNYYGVMLLLLDANEKTLRLKAIAGGYRNYFPKDLTLKVGQGMVGRAAKTHKVQVSNDVKTNPYFIKKAKESTRSELAVPIISDKKLVGVLDIQSDRVNAFKESDLDATYTLTTQIATAIENARLYQQAQKEIAERREVEKELRKSRNSLQKAKRETDEILENAAEGLFLLNSKYELSSQYSKALEDIFQENNLAKKNIMELVKNRIPDETMLDVRRYLELMFDPRVDEISVNELNPLTAIEMNFNMHQQLVSEMKCLSFKFKRIISDGQFNELLVSVDDITEQVRLEKRLNEIETYSKKRLEWLIGILHVEPKLLLEFIENAQMEVDAIIDVMRNADHEDMYRQVIEKIEESVHLIKDNAGLLDLAFFSNMAHEAEDILVKIKNKTEIQGKDFIGLNLHLNEIKNSLREVNSLIEKMSTIQSLFRPKRSYESEKMLNSIKNFISNLSTSLNKQVILVHDHFDGTTVPHLFKNLIKDITLQLARNSIRYGIETVEERRDREKSESGTIEIRSQLKDTKFEFSYRDDGCGLQFDKLIQRAKILGKWDSATIESWTESDVGELIFEPGIYTSENFDPVTKRGIGMNTIKDKIKKFNGKITINNLPGKSFEFKIDLPLYQNQL